MASAGVANRLELSSRTFGRRRSAGRRRSWTGLAFVAPLLVAVLAFVVYPLGRVIYLSLTDYSGLGSPHWIGFENYTTLLHSTDFHRVMLNAGLLLLGMPLWVGIPFLIAVALFGQRGAGSIRSLLLIPGILPPVVAGAVFRIVLADDGPTNATLRGVGLDGLALSWLASDPLVLVTVVVVILWAVMGTGVMFYSAGLATMPNENVEAAILDGAGWRHLVWHIYRPALRPVTSFWILILILSTVTAFFPWIFSLTRGGPGYASTTIDYYVYQTGLVSGQFGLASAASVIGVVFVAVVLGLAALRQRRV
jgi:ABC-type sugar transport system permease subunit